ncbi:MAG: hypothetical protein ACI87W_002693 [Halieaceae bacterium]|jgi:hypothetical protein
MTTKADPKDFNTPGRKTLADADLEGLASAVLELSRELWVLKDRQAVTEAVLAARGIDIREDIESFRPDAELQEQLNQRGAALAASILNVMAGIDGE